MATELNKYRLLLGYGKCGTYVAAMTPEEAVAAHFPERVFAVKDEGKGWVRYESDRELPSDWPQNEDGITDGGGTILDVELVGTILVVT